MLLSSAMRRLLLLALVALPLPLSLLACKPHKGGDAGADADTAPSASASASDSTPDTSPSASASTAATTHTGGHLSVPVAGNACIAATETMACSPDRQTQLSCNGGIWRAVQTCHGAGACKGLGPATTCDVGNPVIGDPCLASTPSRCTHGASVQQCAGGKWTETVCMPPKKCVAGVGATPAACK